MTIASAAVSNSTNVMMTTVAGDLYSIGYVSMGSLNDTVKAVNVDGAPPTTDAIKSGSYKVSRPFNIILPADMPDHVQDFVNFIMSKEGQTVIDEEGYISVDGNAPAYENHAGNETITILGSSSVTPVMEKLAEAYGKLTGVTVEVQQQDSTSGVKAAQEGTADLGMASRDLKDSETGVTAQTIAMDGIAVIVNNDNPVEDITGEDIMKIYTGETITWNEIFND